MSRQRLPRQWCVRERSGRTGLGCWRLWRRWRFVPTGCGPPRVCWQCGTKVPPRQWPSIRWWWWPFSTSCYGFGRRQSSVSTNGWRATTNTNQHDPPCGWHHQNSFLLPCICHPPRMPTNPCIVPCPRISCESDPTLGTTNSLLMMTTTTMTKRRNDCEIHQKEGERERERERECETRGKEKND